MSTEKYEGLEVVAWQDAENPLYTTAERRVLHDWANNGYPIVELCRLSDAQRAIAELREERDTLRQQLAERDAQIASMRAEVTPFIETHWMPVARQRDKLAGLLRDARLKMGYMLNYGEWYSPEELLERIDAALAEVNP